MLVNKCQEISLIKGLGKIEALYIVTSQSDEAVKSPLILHSLYQDLLVHLLQHINSIYNGYPHLGIIHLIDEALVELDNIKGQGNHPLDIRIARTVIIKRKTKAHIPETENIIIRNDRIVIHCRFRYLQVYLGCLHPVF